MTGALSFLTYVTNFTHCIFLTLQEEIHAVSLGGLETLCEFSDIRHQTFDANVDFQTFVY